MLLLLLTFLVAFKIDGIYAVSSSKKTCIITGANRGIGLAAVKQLAVTNEWNIIMACRSKDNIDMALRQITKGQANCFPEILDLADLDSVKSFCDRWKKSGSIDVLACNAGIQQSTSGLGGKENGATVARTKQGYENTVGTNHIGHFLLINRLMNGSINKNSGRIVLVGSGVHDPDEAGGNVGSKATLGNFKGLKDGFTGSNVMIDGSEYDPDKAYKDSKLCNVITTLELSRKFKNSRSKITVNTMNPGLIPTTGLFRDINPIFVLIFTFLTKYVFRVTSSEEEGGRRLAYLIADPEVATLSGEYFTGKAGTTEFQPKPPSKEAQDPTKGSMLWTLTCNLLKSGRYL